MNLVALLNKNLRLCTEQWKLCGVTSQAISGLFYCCQLEPTEQVESNLQSEKDICSDIKGIIQLDETGDASPKEEMSHTKDTEENEFVDIIESEDLKVLEDEDEGEDEEGDSISNMDSGSSSCDNEEPQIDIVEEVIYFQALLQPYYVTIMLFTLNTELLDPEQPLLSLMPRA